MPAEMTLKATARTFRYLDSGGGNGKGGGQ